MTTTTTTAVARLKSLVPWMIRMGASMRDWPGLFSLSRLVHASAESSGCEQFGGVGLGEVGEHLLGALLVDERGRPGNGPRSPSCVTGVGAGELAGRGGGS